MGRTGKHPFSAKNDLKDFLDFKAEYYNQPQFILTDPISIPHQFTRRSDIELAAFFSAVIAWGQRPTILKNAANLMRMMDNSPSDFLLNAQKEEMDRFRQFVHRTFNGTDCIYFIHSMQFFLKEHGSLGNYFENNYETLQDVAEVLIRFRSDFFKWSEPGRSGKHLADVSRNASAKRMNMFLRWMVRNDKRGVDFGLWKKIPSAALYMPLDVHSGNVARRLGLLTRKQNDWKAVKELTLSLRKFDPMDPVKYDFALFGLGVFEKF